MLIHILGPVDPHRRASRFAALGDVSRLSIVDALLVGDRSPGELAEIIGCDSNLLAHHLRILEDAELIRRVKSQGDGRRRYVQLVPAALDGLLPTIPSTTKRRALFVCTRNSARSQLAAALWKSSGAGPAESAGTHPADRVHPGAVAAACRIGLDIASNVPKHLDDVDTDAELVITVCDEAREEIEAPDEWIHWSIPDPVKTGRAASFDTTVRELARRIESLNRTQETRT
ncbi:MAG: hypothetical protein RIS41_2320 [Actinomycetota bacterium]